MFGFNSLHIPITHAADRLLVLGGSGDKAGETNIFTQGFLSFSSSYSGFKISGAFDGSHPQDRQLVNQAFGQNLPTFTAENAKKQLADLIKDPSLKAGNQVLLVINTHGRPPSSNNSLHCVETEGGQCWPLDLKATRDALKKKGVRLAIIDTSCYSGSTIDLADESTCVITAADKNHPSFTDFAEMLAKRGRSRPNEPEAENLEELFFKSLYNSNTKIHSPQISSPLGKQLQTLSAPIVGSLDTAQWLDKEKWQDKKTAFVQDILSEIGGGSPRFSKDRCLNPGPFVKLLGTFNTVDQALTRRVTEELIEHIHEYNKNLKTIDELVAEMNVNFPLPDLKVEGHLIKSRYLDPTFDIETDLQWAQSSLNGCPKGHPVCKEYERDIETIKWISSEGRREEILEQNPQYQGYADAMIRKDQLASRLGTLTREIMTKYRLIAQKLYEKEQKTSPPANACSSFKLNGTSP